MENSRATAVKLPILLSLALVFVLALTGVAQAQSWSDLDNSILADYDITAAQVGEISEGYPDGTWHPYQGMTRAQFVKMAVERFGLPLVTPTTPSFQDISTQHFYYSYIETAYAAGVIVGVGDGYFAPDRVVTRSEGAAIIVRYLASLDGTTTEALYSANDIERILQPFVETPAEIGQALADEMAAAVDWGILRGTADSRLNPRQNLTRIQGAALLIRADIPETRDVQVSLYFSHNGLIVPVHRTVTIGPALEVGEATLNQLFSGLAQGQSADLTSEIPQATNLIGLDIQNGLATVNLDSDFTAAGDQTEHSLQMRLAQVLYTLTQFPSVDRVAFQEAGQPLSSLGGIDLTQPLGRPVMFDEPLADLTPDILVESPAFYDEIVSAVRVYGSANVFEASFILEIRDENQMVLVEEVVTATSGTGTRGTFDVTVPYPAPSTQTGYVVVYWESPQDGSAQGVLHVPVTFND